MKQPSILINDIQDQETEYWMIIIKTKKWERNRIDEKLRKHKTITFHRNRLEVAIRKERI